MSCLRLCLVDVKGKAPFGSRDVGPLWRLMAGWQYSFQGGIHYFGQLSSILGHETKTEGL